MGNGLVKILVGTTCILSLTALAWVMSLSGKQALAGERIVANKVFVKTICEDIRDIKADINAIRRRLDNVYGLRPGPPTSGGGLEEWVAGTRYMQTAPRLPAGPGR